MVKHSVIFKFKTEVSADDRQGFFEAAYKLSNISGVKNLEVMRQASPKNKFEFGILMDFDNAEMYQKYNFHRDHDLFIQNYWMKMVETFLEIDYEPII